MKKIKYKAIQFRKSWLGKKLASVSYSHISLDNIFDPCGYNRKRNESMSRLINIKSSTPVTWIVEEYLVISLSLIDL
jgi:hypothetical protein